MLKKLIKYDFKSTSRVMWYLYIGMMIVAILFGITVRAQDNRSYTPTSIEVNGTINKISDILLTSFGLTFVLLVQAVAIVTVIMIVMRFWRNILGGEGYLMHTLPVKTSDLIWSKLIVSVLWMVIAGVAGIISALLFGLTSGWLIEVLKDFSLTDLIKYIVEAYGASVWLTLLLAIVGSVSWVLKFYASMAIGNLADRNKFFFAVLSFVGITVAITIINSILGVHNGGILEVLFREHTYNRMVIGMIIVEVITAVAYFLVTNYILKKKLNLA